MKYTYKRPWLYEKQRIAFFSPERYSLIEGSTKSGKTVSCMAWLFEQALQGKPGDNYLWVAPILNQAKIAYRRYKRGIPAFLYIANDSDNRLTLPNGAMMWFKGSDDPDSIYGEDYKAAVVDEASRCKEAAWYAVRSTLTATKGPVRIIGNVKGRKNWFFKMCRKAQNNEDPNYRYTKITALDAVAAGVLDQSEIDDAKANLPENVFRELYLAEPSDDGGNPFGLKHIANCVAEMSQGRPEACGVDLAKSVDWTVVIALDKAGATCGFERWQGPWNLTKPRILDLVGRTPCKIDSTGVGDPIVEELQSKRNNFEGFKFTASSKQQLMEGLAVAIQQRQITYPDGLIRDELDNFEYVMTRTGVRYSAPEGYHDDCVVALALAYDKWRGILATINPTKPASLPRVSPWTG